VQYPGRNLLDAEMTEAGASVHQDEGLIPSAIHLDGHDALRVRDLDVGAGTVPFVHSTDSTPDGGSRKHQILGEARAESCVKSLVGVALLRSFRP
jgi:hypothetical protein